MSRACCFCGNTPVTNEHVYPNWLSAYFVKGMPAVNEISHDGVSKTWNKAIFQHKAKVVYHDCNHGWMSDLENDTKPLLEQMIFGDSTIQLDKNSQRLISFWVQKTVMTLNKSTNGGFSIPKNFYDELYANKGPLKGIAVNIGWRLKSKGTKEEPIATFEIKQIGSVQVQKDHLESVKADINAGKLVWSSTLGLGKLVFHLFGHNLNGTVEIVGVDNQLLKQINPAIDGFSWPLEWPIETVHDLESMRKAM